MKQKTSYIGMIGAMMAFIIMGATFSSCIYDDTDDCRTELRIRFKYDYNMKFADAFAHEVKTVHLYAYDESGKLALEKTATVSGEGYTMNVNELKTDTKYNFVVWAEGENRGDSYDFGSSATETGLTAKVKRTDAKVTTDLTPLFHGRVTGASFAAKYGTTQTVDIPLVKDTKNIKLVLQEQDGTKQLDPNDFIMEITDDNGFLNYDNSLLSDETLSYSPWSVTAGQAGADNGVSTKAARETVLSVIVSEFTTNRLVADGHKPRLTVWNKNKTDKPVFSIPLIDYILLVKGNYNRDMSDQEYIDRQDTYDMVFIIDNGHWLSSYIYINSWRVVPPQNEDMK